MGQGAGAEAVPGHPLVLLPRTPGLIPLALIHLPKAEMKYIAADEGG
jgi:hypothetical protein